jgi:hypothetical protein
MTSQLNAQLARVLIDARLRSTMQWVLEPTSKRALLIVGGVIAGLALADLLAFGAAIADAAPPPKTPTGPGPE